MSYSSDRSELTVLKNLNIVHVLIFSALVFFLDNTTLCFYNLKQIVVGVVVVYRRRKTSLNLPVIIVAVVIMLCIRLVSFVGGMIDSAFESIAPSPTPKPTVSTSPTSYSAASYKAISPTATPNSSSAFETLRSGSTGVDVELLQMRLNALGYSIGTADGSYGPKTVAAVMAFQKAAGLTADGIAGQKTQIRLFASSAPTAPPDYGTNTASSTAASDTSSEKTESSSASYVGNRNSKKFHHSWCSSVSDMKASNSVSFDSRSEAIDCGYKPCGRCNP